MPFLSSPLFIVFNNTHRILSFTISGFSRELIFSPLNPKVITGDPVTFFCKTPWDSEPTIRWYRNGDIVSATSRLTILLIPYGSILRVHNAKSEDDGATFRCSIPAPSGVSTSASTTLELYTGNKGNVWKCNGMIIMK